MDVNQVNGVIEYEDLWFESEIAASAADFPAQEMRLEIRRSPAAEYQLGGLFETVIVTLDPVIVQSLLGIGGAFLAGATAKVGAKAGEKLLELLTEDIYEWTKRLLKRLGAHFSRDPSQKWRREPKKGVRVHIKSRDQRRILCIFHLIYSHDGMDFDPHKLEKGLRLFELMLRPVISAISVEEEISEVIIQGWLGPGEDDPRWGFMVETKKNSYDFPGISAEGKIEWQTGSEGGREKLRETLHV